MVFSHFFGRAPDRSGGETIVRGSDRRRGTGRDEGEGPVFKLAFVEDELFDVMETESERTSIE